MTEKRQLVIRDVEVCAKCGEVMPWRKTCGTRTAGVQRVAWARCKWCGHMAQIRYVARNRP